LLVLDGSGQRSSIVRIIRSAILIESEIAAINFGDGDPPFQSATLRAAKIDAAISSTRFLPSSIGARYHIRLIFAYLLFLRPGPCPVHRGVDASDCLLFSPLRDCRVPAFDSSASGLH